MCNQPSSLRHSWPLSCLFYPSVSILTVRWQKVAWSKVRKTKCTCVSCLQCVVSHASACGLSPELWTAAAAGWMHITHCDPYLEAGSCSENQEYPSHLSHGWQSITQSNQRPFGRQKPSCVCNAVLSPLDQARPQHVCFWSHSLSHVNLCPGQALSLPVTWCPRLAEMLEVQFVCQDTVQTSISTSDWMSPSSSFPLLGTPHVLFSKLGLLFLAALLCEQWQAKAAIYSSTKQYGQSLAPAELPGMLRWEGWGGFRVAQRHFLSECLNLYHLCCSRGRNVMATNEIQ